MKKIQILLLISLFSLTSCNTIKTVVLLKKGKVEENTYDKEIPITIINGTLGVVVKIEGKEYFLFFDTGAMNVLSEFVSKELNLKPKVEMEATDVHNNQDVFYFTKVNAIELSGITYKNQGAAVFDFSKIPEVECYSTDGILGANLMRNSVWQINMQDSLFHITDNIDQLQIPASALTLKFKPNISSTPIVTVKVGNVEFDDVVFDFGASGGIDLVYNETNFSALNVNSKIVEHYGSQSLGMFGGNFDTTYSFYVDSIQIGDLVYTNNLLHLRKTGTSTIGTTIFQNYIVTIDWDKEHIYLEPQPEFIKEETDDYGISVRRIDGELTIIGLNSSTDAYAKGLQIGDRIMKVDDIDYSSMTDEQYCDMFKNGLFPEDSNSVEITIERDSIVNTIQIKRKDWFDDF